MDADSSVELGPSAPALEVPWSDPVGQLAYVDLRSDPALLEQNIRSIPEAQQFPPLRDFLLAVNSGEHAWESVKCDVWSEEPEEKGEVPDALFTHGCYVDVVLTQRYTEMRDSLEFHQRTAGKLAELLDEHDDVQGSAEIVVRRCYFHRDSTPEEMEWSDDGYCLTLFISGHGESATQALEAWGKAMNLATKCLLNLPLQ